MFKIFPLIITNRLINLCVRVRVIVNVWHFTISTKTDRKDKLRKNRANTF